MFWDSAYWISKFWNTNIFVSRWFVSNEISSMESGDSWVFLLTNFSGMLFEFGLDIQTVPNFFQNSWMPNLVKFQREHIEIRYSQNNIVEFLERWFLFNIFVLSSSFFFAFYFPFIQNSDFIAFKNCCFSKPRKLAKSKIFEFQIASSFSNVRRNWKFWWIRSILNSSFFADGCDSFTNFIFFIFLVPSILDAYIFAWAFIVSIVVCYNISFWGSVENFC